MKKSGNKYNLDTKNGSVRVFINDLLLFDYIQLDYKGRYFYKDFHNVYGLDIYLKDGTAMEIYFKTKEVWLSVNKLMLEFL